MNENIFNRCILWALNNKVLILLLSTIFICITIYKINDLNMDAVPDITNVQVVINTKTLGLEPEKIELTVTKPIEFEMMGLPRLEDMRSISKYGLSQVTLIFKDNTDIYWARQLVSERLITVSGQFDKNLQPELAPISTGLGEVFMYALEIDPKSNLINQPEKDQLLYLREVQDYIVRPFLRKIKDVADIDTNGGFKKQLHININPHNLIKNGLTLSDIESKLSGLGESFGGGTIAIKSESFIIKSNTKLNDLQDILNISVSQKYNGQKIYLKDIATVSFDAAPRLGGASVDGHETVLGTVLMKSGANGREVSHNVEVALQNLSLPKDVVFKKLYSRKFLVNATLKTVLKSLAEGAGLVILILLLLLGNFKAALLVSLIIPISMLGTSLGMQAFGISGNLMSLGAIDFGLVVDGSVVLVEALIASFYTINVSDYKNFSKDAFIFESAKKVIRPIIFGISMIMLVYLPVMFLEGIEGKMFKPMAYSVLLTLGWSLLFTVFLIPVLFSYVIKIPTHHQQEHDPLLFRVIKRQYEFTLKKLINWPKSLILFGIITIIISLITFLNLGSDFIPQLDEGDLVINITRNPKINIDEALKEQTEVEKIILKNKEVNTVFSRLGTPESATDPMGVHLADTFIILDKDRSKWSVKTKEELFQKINKQINNLGYEGDISSTQPIEMRFNEMLEGSRADISIKVMGPNLDYLVQEINTLEEKMKTVKGLESAEMDPLTALRKSKIISITPKFSELSKLNMSLQNFNNTVVHFMHGMHIGQWIEDTKTYPIIIHLSEELRDNIEQIKNLPVPLPEVGSVALNQIANIEVMEQVTTIARSWGIRYAALSLNIANRDTSSFVNDVKSILDTNPVDKNHSIHLAGQFNNLVRAKKRLFVIIPFTLLLIFLILWKEFNSFRDALLIFLGVPFAACGGIFSLYIRNINLSLSAAVGFIALIGIALLNGIVLLTVFNQLKEQNKNNISIYDLVYQGTISRLRPVIMTALVASIGFIPMALNTGIGAEVQRPLATVVIGGIIFSTALTLIILPTVYLFLNSFKINNDEESK